MTGFRGAAIATLLAAGVAAGMLAAGCGKKDVKQEVVATANGEEIRVLDLREFLGAPAGVFAVTNLSADKKKEALDRLVSMRLLAQEGRSRGIDNSAQFRDILRQNEQGILIGALLRKEIDEKIRLDDDKEIKAEAARLKEAKTASTDADALAQARKTVAESRIRKLQEELVATARKEASASVDQAMIDRIGKGEKVPDNAVLGTAGDGKVLYGDVRKILQGAVQGGAPPGGQDPSRNPAIIANVVNRELVGRALAEYARKQGIEKSDWYRISRQELERNILVSLDADNVVARDITVTDREIEAAYKEHSAEMVRNGQKIPLAAVKEQMRMFLLNEKRRKALDAHVAELKGKAKITVNEAVLAKV